MPELPEVQSAIDSLSTATPPLIGARICRAEFVWPGVIADNSCPGLQQSLVAASFISVKRLGKYMIFGLQAGPESTVGCFFLIVHLRMTGRLELVPATEARTRHTRFAIYLEYGPVIRFDDPRKFGRIWLVSDPVTVLGNLGPDALGIRQDLFLARLGGVRRQLKPLLLDQSFIAGIGNIYADEILFRAAMHPLLNASLLSPDDAIRLHSAIVSVLDEAVKTGGANIDGVFKAGRFKVSVYGRQGKPCLVCGSGIVKIRVGQRGTHYCPVCQPAATTLLEGLTL